LVLGHTYSPRQEPDSGTGADEAKIYRQYVSSNVFGVFGLRPALGRLLTSDDDRTPGANAVAVLSYDYWTRRFARDPHVLGKTMRVGNDRLEIVGVAPQGFIGTEPGGVTDVFVPAMMNREAINSPGWSWFRIWARPKPGFSAEQVRQPLQALLTREHEESIKHFQSDTPRQVVDAFRSERLLLFPAASGASDVRRQYRDPLVVLAVLVALVLLIACANVGNLLTAQAAERAREMGLRVAIGAGQWRLIQLVLVESALLAMAASVFGTLSARWWAPWVVSRLRVPADPVRLILDAGPLEMAFSAGLALMVTLLFGLAPALRVSTVKPMSALKGGGDPRVRSRLMQMLLSAQVAFCVAVLFVAGLFVTTFERLANRPLGFSHQNVLVMDAATNKEQPLQVWMQVADGLLATPGVESAALGGWPLLSENRWTRAVHLPGRAADARPPYFLEVSPGFFATMRIGMVDGRDFRLTDVPPRFKDSAQPLPGVGIVNEEFSRTYFGGQNPVGRSIDVRPGNNVSAPMEIVGWVRDAAYSDLREPIRPTVYVPMGSRGENTLLVRTAGDPLALAPILRREVSQARPNVRVLAVQAQSDFVAWHMVRERLLATLSFFFGIVALVLAAIGLYGVLNYSVTQRRKEIGIRLAIGAPAARIARLVTAEIFTVVLVGALAGVGLGVALSRFVEALFYQVKPSDPGMLALPAASILAAAVLAALPAVFHAVRIDPVEMLRAE
jgi:predicted permease